MNNKWKVVVIITVIIGLIVGISISVFFKKGETDKIDYRSEKELADIKKQENELNKLENENTMETVSKEELISPNAIIIKKTYYEACDHLIRKTENIPEELVNRKKEDVKSKFLGWKIEEFSPTQITLYKTDKGNCAEHYFVKENDGVIGIYTIDEYGIKTFKENTEISTQYLPEEDIKTLKSGVEIVGDTELVEFLEDYE